VNYHIQVKLDLNAFAVMGKQVDAVQGSFDKAKKEFNLPSVCIQHDNLILDVQVFFKCF
jgi:hypothetical protein